MFPVDTTTRGLKNVCSTVEILKGSHCNKSYSREQDAAVSVCPCGPLVPSHSAPYKIGNSIASPGAPEPAVTGFAA